MKTSRGYNESRKQFDPDQKTNRCHCTPRMKRCKPSRFKYQQFHEKDQQSCFKSQRKEVSDSSRDQQMKRRQQYLKSQRKKASSIARQLHKDVPGFFECLPAHHKKTLDEWIESNTIDLPEKIKPIQFGLFILKYLYANPFFSKLNVTVNGESVVLKKRLSQVFRKNVFDQLDSEGKKAGYERSWLFCLKTILVSEAYETFGSNSYISPYKLCQRVAKTHLSLNIGYSNNVYPADFVRMACSKYARQYLTTFKYPPRPGRLVQFCHNNKQYLQFSDTYEAEIYIAKALKKIIQNNQLEDELPIDSEILDGLYETQKQAVYSVSKNRLTIISGKAGTGKSRTVMDITSWLQENGLNVFCVSPYHKTVTRLKELAKERDESRLKEHCTEREKEEKWCSTTSSWSFKYTTVKNEGHMCPCVIQGCVVCDTDVLILDESGITSTHDLKIMFEWLTDKKRPSKRLVLVGDVNQLPPISGGSAISAVIGIVPNSVITLDTVKRAGDELNILANNILNGLSSVVLSDTVKIIDRDRIWDNCKEDLADTIVVTNSNKEADVINTLISKNHMQSIEQQYYKGPAHRFFTGEIVCVTKGEHNGSRGTVVTWRYNNPANSHNNDSNDPDDTDTPADDLFCVIKLLGTDEEINIPMVDISPGYAVTINKAQGSEFKKVFVIVDGHGLRLYGNKRWMYTAVTRAKKKIYFVTNDMTGMDIYDQVLKNPCPPLDDTTCIKLFFQDEKGVVETKQDPWKPLYPLVKYHDKRLQQNLPLEQDEEQQKKETDNAATTTIIRPSDYETFLNSLDKVECDIDDSIEM